MGCKNNFEQVLRFVMDVGDEDIALHLEHAPKNASYTSTFTAEQILKVIGDYLNQHITILADESTDEGHGCRCPCLYILSISTQTSLLKES